LTQIFAGKAGGHPAQVASHIATVAGVETVPIQFESEGKSGRMKVGRVGEPSGSRSRDRAAAP
jgi:hypothetical protein